MDTCFYLFPAGHFGCQCGRRSSWAQLSSLAQYPFLLYCSRVGLDANAEQPAEQCPNLPMRFRLRTLLILLGIAPQVLAVLWWIAAANPAPASAILIGYGLLAFLWGVCWLLDKRNWRGRST